MPEFSIEVENYPLRFFATTIGDLDPIRHDEAAARAAGYRSLVAPPTYVSCLINMADPAPCMQHGKALRRPIQTAMVVLDMTR